MISIRIWRALLSTLLGVLLLHCGAAQALDSKVKLDDYHHDIWGVKHGAPQEIHAMAQTPDGWLWIGTTNGLYRFDGVHFEPFQPAGGEGLLSRRISALNAQPNGDLWVGYTFGGLSVIRDGRVQHYASGAASPVGATYKLAIDTDGSLWVASSTGLMHYSGGAWHRRGADWHFPGVRAENVQLDQYGELWASDGEMLYALDRAAKRFRPTGLHAATPLLAISPDGRLWQADGETVTLVPQHATRPVPRQPWLTQSASHSGLFDRDGNFWSKKCPVGICVTRPETWNRGKGAFARDKPDETLQQRWQMGCLNVHVVLEDREGNIWVGTTGGLERFRHNKLATSRLAPEASRYSLAQDAEGQTWVASADNGVLWRLTEQGEQQAAPGQRRNMVTRGFDGSVLVGGVTHVERRRHGKTELIALPPLRAGEPEKNFVLLLQEDSRGLWANIGGRGLFRLENGVWRRPGEHIVPNNPLFAAPGAEDSTWFSYRNNRIVHLKQGKLTEYGPGQGLNLGTVGFIDASHELLASGDGGLQVLKDGTFRQLRAAQPELLQNLSGLVVTPNGDRWLNAAKGAMHIAARDWQASMADPDTPLRYELWDSSDGYPGGAEILVRRPSAAIGTDGRLWFVGTAGVAWFDPRHVKRNTVAPPVKVLGLSTAQRAYQPAENIRLEPRTSKLQIAYTALSYSMPERVRFRVRLDGVDQDWQEAGARRVAYYTNLGPGSYRFRVSAVNEDGVRSGADAVLSFEIAPAFTQTRWFYALCALLLVALGWGLYWLRLRRLHQQFHGRLQERLIERERIARTLHDTFLQSLHGLILHVHAAANLLPAGGDAHRMINKALDQADEVLAEGRDQVLDLRLAAPTRRLARALGDAACSMVGNTGAALVVTLTGEETELTPAVCDEAYLIGREALSNAFRHAAASRVELELDYGSQHFRMTVRDDGKGIAADIIDAGRPGRWGLVGMRERAARVGATLKIDNRPQRGLEICLCVPARLAYPGAAKRLVDRVLRRDAA